MKEIIIAFLLLPLSSIFCIIWMEWRFQKIMNFGNWEQKKKYTKENEEEETK